jgi:hypothetical protein
VSWLKHIIFFYRDGFKQMRVGKQLWMIIAIKFFLFFVVLKLFFFPNILKTHFSNDTQRADFVLEHLMKH